MKVIRLLVWIGALSFLLNPAQAGESEHLHHKKQLAVRGYDVVAYFSGEVKKGAKAITAKHQGLTYRFDSRFNLAKFEADPAMYAPQYGGWCATAMAEGDKVDINPKSYKVTGGKLYLFYKGLFGNARKAWDKNEATLTKQADSAWSQLIAD
jgi:hypothetical protein